MRGRSEDNPSKLKDVRIMGDNTTGPDASNTEGPRLPPMFVKQATFR